jgi:ABC-type nitrate/sulfonate/bicarbonate transport system substrate-binding protein
LLRRWDLNTERDLTLVDLGINDRSLEALRAGEIDAALLPPEKAFLAETEGFRVVADSQELDCHWVPLATTRRFLAANREVVKKIASICVESIRLFKSEPQAALKEIGRWLPALEKKPQVLEKCYELFAARFEPTLMPSLSSISSILNEVALQDPRAGEITAASIVEKLI